MSNSSPEEAQEAFYIDLRTAYDQGWEDAYKELSHLDESRIPPLLRRFFWYDTESFDEEALPWWRIVLSGQGADEYCNPVFGVRMLGGVLYIRYGWKVRGPLDGRCEKCEKELS